MHELAISETICKVIEKEASKRGMKRVTKAKLRIGKMEAFDKSNLEVCLKTFKDSEIISGIHFEIEEVPVRLRCDTCGFEFLDERFDDHHFAHETAHAQHLYSPPKCPKCGDPDSTIVSGKEMELVSIEG